MWHSRGNRIAAQAWAFGLAATLVPVTHASEMGELAADLVTEQSYRHLLDDMLFTHDGHNRAQGAEHDLAMANIAILMSNFGLDVTLEPFDYDGTIHYNVVGTKWGTLYPDREYVVGAHYDSVGNPGADDNASGVALILEAARVLTGQDSDYTIRFVAFDLEELGLKGSYAYALDHIGDDIRGMIGVDMVAWNRGGDIVDIHANDSSASLATALAAAVSTYGNSLGYELPGPSAGSDHFPFQAIGVDACLLIEDWGNPCWHRLCDSVDNPDYIDYEFATNNARSVVGFLVDHAGIAIELLDADFDGDADVDADDYAEFELCLSDAPPLELPCIFFDLDTDGDVDCTDATLFTNAWTEMDTPPPVWPCMPLPPEVHEQGARALTVTPQEHELPMALLVEGDATDPAVSCMSLYIQPDGTLSTTPIFQTHNTWATITVQDGRIVPATAYRVWSDYGDAAAPGRSVIGSKATTLLWGDVAGAFYGGEWTPPNGTVDFNDILAVVEAFRHLPAAPPAAAVDLMGPSATECIPDQVIDFLDISADVEAFRGSSYWETTSCPTPCD